ncbi:dynein beta chain, ciliary-like isoform X9 [Augochlora pura]
MKTKYNRIRTESVPVEYQLIEEDVEEIDNLINFGQENYDWNSPEVREYVDNLLAMVKRLHIRLFRAQDNLKNIMDRLYLWAMTPVLYRKDARDENLLLIADKDDRFEERFTEIGDTADELARILEENYKLFFNLMPESYYELDETNGSDVQMLESSEVLDELVPDSPSTELEIEDELAGEQEEAVEEEEEVDEETQALRREKWQPYLTYVDNLISKGLIQAVSTSICYILDETDPEGDMYPLFEIQLHLENPSINFRPRIEIDDPDGFYPFFESLLLDMMKMGIFIPRVNPEIAEEQENYATDVADEFGISFMLEETCNRVKMALADLKDHVQIYEAFSWLWTDNRQEYLEYFLQYSQFVTIEDREMIAEHPDYIPEHLKPKKPDLADFKLEIDYFMDLYQKCDEIPNEYIASQWLRLDVKPFKQTLLNIVCKWANVLKDYLVNRITTQLQELSEFLQAAMENFSQSIQEDDYEALLVTISYLKEIRDRQFEIEDMFDPIKKTIELLEQYQVVISPKIFEWLTELPHTWESLKKLSAQVKQVVQPLMTRQIELLKKRLSYYDFKQQRFLDEFHKNPVFDPECTDPYEKLNKIREGVVQFLGEEKNLKDQTVIFEQEMPEFKVNKQVQKEMQLLKTLWDYVNVISTSLNEWKKTTWKKLDIEWMDQECKKILRELRQLDKDVRGWKLYTDIEAQVRNMMASLRAVSELQNPAIRDRHWRELMAETKVVFSMSDNTTLEDLLKLELHKYEEEVKNIVAKSVKEMAMEKVLKELHDTWSTLEFGKDLHDRTKLNVLRIDEEAVEILEDNQVQLQNMLGSKFVGYFLDEILDWQRKLSNADAIINAWFEVQRAWMHLESIFIGSEDIRSQLPEESKRFEKIDRDFKELLREMMSNLNIVKATNRPKLLEKLEELQIQLNICEKALADYLETKRLIYPRFYFISSADLLDILSNGNNPELVCRHLSKLYDSIANLSWKMDGGKPTKTALVMVAKDGEHMPIHGPCDCSGKVENWLNNVTDAMKRTVRHHMSQAVGNYDEKPREQWIFDHLAQPALTGSQIWWTTEVNMAFMRLEEGFENAFKDYQRKQINQLNALITILCGDLDPSDRMKIMTICTIDVHARDVVGKMITMKAENSSSFQWQSQLRHRWDDKAHDCFADICDATFRYSHEYLGNVPRLVITPLTDRCYITLTQSLHLVMGGAPAGPAGTGKTETTKDLGRALGQMVYVFNCSEQMDYKSCGNIYKGLAQVGAWGCFDEFNRISVEVLSVVAVQVKSVLDGIKSGKSTFLFFGEELNLIPTVGMFITMNPGYAGRTELPENLKTLFRPCAMVVPDFDLICEIMLVAEGFQEARLLARKFITLYQLCRELLSKQDHYDWGLRAIKSVLVVAGKLKRDDPQRPEDQVLMRALRDFNIPKIVTDDVPVFMGLIGDLFPALDVPRKRDLEFELTVKESAVDLKLQPEDGFILKVVQLEELLHVRHSVFIVGFAGTGKTEVWKTLNRTYFNQKLKPYYNDLNPKAVTNDELFGIINPATREWKDGLFSVIMRDQANMTGNDPKWIIFDGDIDPMWIESLNTVMDDNKVLTLASNERIALTPHMRLLFEISNLRTATPATVSRAGILYINPQDIGWYPFAISWIETREASERANLTILFDKYVPPLVEVMKNRFKKITPLPDICHVEMLCNLLDCFLTPESVPPDCPKEWHELYFVFACIWAFGSATFQDQLVDWRNEFNKWWQVEFKTVKFPPGGNIFNYFIEDETKKLLPWTEKVKPFELDADIPLQELDETTIFTEPIIFCHFAEGIGEPKYMPIKDWPQLTKLLDEALHNYNDLVAAMNLILFEDAMYQVCQINRILESPRGNALLVGVGGSGKQSLSSLASFISTLEVFQMQLKTGYSMNDMRTDLAGLYLRAGLKSIGITFLMTDSHVADERFLVLINDMLAFGEISELFADDEVDNIVNGVRNEVKQTGMLDTNENCWKFFIDRVRIRLKCVLCFSPVGSTLRNRARQFPAIVNNTSINWVQSWPLEALKSVSARFLEGLEELPKEYKNSASQFMSFVHTSVNDISTLYLQNERRYNYTTPKSFLEQIALYTKLLIERTYDLKAMIERLKSGLDKLESCASQVGDLRVVLAVQEVELKKKNEIADKILTEVRFENTKAEAEKAIVSEEEAKIAEIKEVVAERQKRCDEDLAKAEPAVRQAEAALDTLNKNNLTELKSFGTPPDTVAMVAQAVLVLFAPRGQIPKDRSWKACKAMMGSVDTFLSQLRNYDKENIHAEVVKAIQPYINNKEFDPEIIYSKSQAAAGLCSWVRNIMVFHYINETVKPLRAALAQANSELKSAMDHLNSLRARLAELQKVLDVLGERMNTALQEKQKCQDEADATALTIDLANRLVNGLASEKIRWTETVETLTNSGVTVPGDILLVTAFLSYMGCFTRKYRYDLMYDNWLPFLENLDVKIPRTPDLDILGLLSDDAQIAEWNNQGLPTDKMSSENATILMNSSRWPLMIDPQLQGLKWIKNRYGDDLKVLRLTQHNYLSVIEIAIANGGTVLIENIMEGIDPVLDPVIKRDLIKKGRAIKIWDKEIDYDHNFRLILQTKLANPHYKPEIQAQTTLINFTVTKDGLEEQLLGDVVKAERPDLESKKAELTTQQNTFKITLKVLEDDLLHRLSTAGPNILSDVDLVINLETTKKTAAEIQIKVAEAKVTSVKIDEAREIYRIVATRASLLYFVLNDLSKINMLYQFSLKAFSVVFQNAIRFAEEAETLPTRVVNLIDSITYLVFIYTSRGLFENDKLTFLCHMTIQIFMQSEEITQSELDFLLRFPYMIDLISPVDFLTNIGWGGIKYLSQMDDFRNLEKDIEGAAKRWKKFAESETPERENFPQDWKNKTALQRLCIMRCLRLDRMTYALRCFVEEKLGSKFVESRSPPFNKSFEETSSITPVFFILSPGVDPLKDVEKLGKQLGFTFEGRNFHNVSLGQGQEPVAEEAMTISANEGHWVILQNVHLVKKWLPTLEKRMEQLAENPHDDYRLFISAEPSPDPRESLIPQGILESAIKITNEPPSGIQANIHKALDNFSQETLDSCSKETEFKTILFALCYYHAVLAERRKFGAQGWNRSYPFNVGDLTISVSVLFNYLENSIKVPWEDLRYLFGEIMYGGHITDDWDRRLCRTYLLVYLKPELVEGELYLAPEFLVPPNSDYAAYHQYVDDFIPSESPVLYGLHPNAEIGFLTSTAENLFKTLLEMLSQSAGDTEGDMSKEDRMKTILEDLLDKLPEEFNMSELYGKVEDRTPYVTVALQECERMNILCEELKRSLRELDLGLKGELTINAEMEDLQNFIMIDAVPPSWTKRAYPSSLGLNSWFADMLNRLNDLSNWTSDFSLPSSVWLGGFFNPQSFLTAIMQQTARKNEWPLDKMCLYCEVLRKNKEEITSAPREGAYINGLYMDGARWDMQTASIMDSRFKELYPLMPVVYVRAITQDKQDLRNMYECPLYKTRSRGPTYVWTFNLKTKEKAEKWILAGVAILLQI